MNLLDSIRAVSIVPVVALPDPGHAVPLAEALVDGELPIAEVTFRTPAAAEGIRLMTRQCPDMLVGAGTVLTTAQVDAAMDAGAAFIVAPGFDPVVVDYCLERSIPVMPGVCTASELTQAVLRELPAVKFFPAEAMGGLKTLKSLAAPFRPMDFMVTGGLSMDNMAPYLAWDRILAIGGSWMVKKQLLADRDFDRVRALAAEAVRAVRAHRS
jgi:2-dehydro-3-deoxyphosphogluconate aldolase / (4S)-4-hydroxy-2-oxoglutarate aldolase